MYRLLITTRFKKDLKKIKKNPLDQELTRAVIKTLKEEGVLGIKKSMKPLKL